MLHRRRGTACCARRFRFSWERRSPDRRLLSSSVPGTLCVASGASARQASPIGPARLDPRARSHHICGAGAVIMLLTCSNVYTLDPLMASGFICVVHLFAVARTAVGLAGAASTITDRSCRDRKQAPACGGRRGSWRGLGSRRQQKRCRVRLLQYRRGTECLRRKVGGPF